MTGHWCDHDGIVDASRDSLTEGPVLDCGDPFEPVLRGRSTAERTRVNWNASRSRRAAAAAAAAPRPGRRARCAGPRRPPGDWAYHLRKSAHSLLMPTSNKGVRAFPTRACAGARSGWTRAGSAPARLSSAHSAARSRHTPKPRRRRPRVSDHPAAPSKKWPPPSRDRRRTRTSKIWTTRMIGQEIRLATRCPPSRRSSLPP